MKKIRLTERNLQQLVRRVIQETQLLNEDKKCGCGVGVDGADCTVAVAGSSHQGWWDCKCCCCIMDDAGMVRGNDVMAMDDMTMMGESYRPRRRNYRRR